METNLNNKIRVTSGPIKRLMAFSIDIIILNVLFLVIYIVLSKDIHTKLEFWKINFVIFLLYFTICDSYLMKGMSFGKFVLNIAVKNLSGKALNVTISFIRSFLSTMLYFTLSIWTLSFVTLKNYLGEIASISIISCFVSLLISGYSIFMVFHPYNRAIHDILSKSIVVNTNNDYLNINYNNYTISRIFVCYILSTALFLLVFIFFLLAYLLF